MLSTQTPMIVVDKDKKEGISSEQDETSSQEEEEEEDEEDDDDLPEVRNNRPYSKLKYRGIVKVDKLFQPSTGFGTGRKWPKTITVQADPMILHTVHLVDYKTKLNCLIYQKKSLIQHKIMSKKLFPFPELPQLPEVSDKVIKRMRPEDVVKLGIRRPRLSQFFSQTINKKRTQSGFVRGFGICPPVFGKEANQILKKSVIALCGHVGFRGIKESALLTLTDIAGNYMKQFCKVLRMNVDRREEIKEIGHIDALEQTFQDVEGSSMLDLAHFYQERVIKYHSHMLFQCKKLQKTYRDLEALGAAKLKEQMNKKKLQKHLADKGRRIENVTESAGMKKDLPERGNNCAGMKSQVQSQNIEKSGAVAVSPSQDTITPEKSIPSPNLLRGASKKPKPLLQRMKEKTKNVNKDNYLKNYDASELFPDQLSLSTDDSSSSSSSSYSSSSSSETCESVIKIAKKRKRMTLRPDVNRNRCTAKELDEFKTPVSPSVKSKQIMPGAKRRKKRPSQAMKKIPGPSQQLETLVKEVPAPPLAAETPVSAEDSSQTSKPEVPTAVGSSQVSADETLDVVCQRINDAPEVLAQDETLVVQSQPLSLTVEKLISAENMSPASPSMEKPKI